MKPNKEMDNILDECLERLLVRGETIEQCLEGYPQDAAELEPLLRMALAAKKAAAIRPRDEFKARARYQFHSALREVSRRGSRSFFGRLLPQWATVVAIVLVLLLAGGGTVAAAGNSMPDSPLYPVKLATEQVRLMFLTSELGKAEMNAELADKRVAEIIYMAGKGNGRQVQALTRRLDKRLVMLASLTRAVRSGRGAKVTLEQVPAAHEAPRGRGAGTFTEANGSPELRFTIVTYAVEHPAALRAVLEKAPESVRSDVLQAIAVTVAGYERALESLD